MGVLRIIAGASLVLAAPASAFAHGVAGPRFFPATLTIDDPAVADELSVPTLSRLAGDDGAATGVSGEYSKRLTRTFGLSVGESWTRITAPGQPAASGFENLETSAKWQFLTSARHEAILSTGVEVEWSGTGAEGVGAERHTTITPTIWFGKGAGDLPPSMGWARPFALTGQLGYAIPARRRDPGEGEDNPRVLEWGLSLQYSLAYLQTQVKDVGLPQPFAGMVPLVEARFSTPVSGADRRTTGTINPGVIWIGRRFQLGAEALVPINRESGASPGWIVQLHLYLDDIFPRSLGKPIW